MHQTQDRIFSDQVSYSGVCVCCAEAEREIWTSGQINTIQPTKKHEGCENMIFNANLSQQLWRGKCTYEGNSDRRKKKTHMETRFSQDSQAKMMANVVWIWSSLDAVTVERRRSPNFLVSNKSTQLATNGNNKNIRRFATLFFFFFFFSGVDTSLDALVGGTLIRRAPIMSLHRDPEKEKSDIVNPMRRNWLGVPMGQPRWVKPTGALVGWWVNRGGWAKWGPTGMFGALVGLWANRDIVQYGSITSTIGS